MDAQQRLFNGSLKWAKKGDAESQCCLATYYRDGVGTKIFYDNAVHWYMEAMEQNYAEAYFQMGQTHETLQKTKKKKLEDALWFYISPRNLGLENNKDKDSIMALCYYKKAEELGYVQASANVERLSKLFSAELLKKPSEWINDMFSSKAKSTVKTATVVSKVKPTAKTATADPKIKAKPKVKIKLKDKRQFKKALKYAKKGRAAAQCNVGSLYCIGKGVAQDYEQGIKWLNESLKQGYCGAYYNIGVCYENGNGYEKDLSAALKNYRKAEEGGFGSSASEAVIRVAEIIEPSSVSASALYNSGCKYYDVRDGVKKSIYNIENALVYFNKSAEKGNVLAMNMLGYIYCYEEYFLSYSQAYEWSLKAANLGNQASQYRIGLIYEKGVVYNSNLAEAKKWYEKSAAQGNSDAIAALKRLNGAEVAKLKVETGAARKTAEVAKVDAERKTVVTKAASPKPASAPKSVQPTLTSKQWYEKGTAYSNAKNLVEAHKCYAKAAEMGNVEGMCSAAFGLQYGKGVTANPKEAFKLYDKAAQLGFERGLINVARCYKEGVGIERDLDKAKQIYEKLGIEYEVQQCRWLQDDWLTMGCPNEIFSGLPLYDDGYIFKPNISLDNFIKLLNYGRTNDENMRFSLCRVESDGTKYFAVTLYVNYIGKTSFNIKYGNTSKVKKYSNALENAVRSDYINSNADLYMDIYDYKYEAREEEYKRALGRIERIAADSAHKEFIKQAFVHLNADACPYNIIATKDGTSRRIGKFRLMKK